MSPPAHEAAEQLRAIRALMERSTVYRAISAPGALVAGILSLVVCAWLWERREPEEAPEPVVFFIVWHCVLVVVTAVNVVLLYRSARQRGDVFISAGMKHAMRALLPPLVAGFLMSLLDVSAGGVSGRECHADMAANWILFYGLALLATGSFAPRSMQTLGLGFFTFGILTFLPTVREVEGRQYLVAVIHMAFSFGMLHIVYAAAVFILHRRESIASGT
jgi:hypothetical protein